MTKERATRQISVKDITDSDAKAIESALEDPEMRASAIVVGYLLPYSNRKREAIMNLVRITLEEQEP